MNAYPAGGQWFGNGVRSDVFYPSVAGEGKHPLIYIYRENGCVVADTLEATVNGSPAALEHLYTWCKSGPSLAQVDRVDVFDTNAENLPLSGCTILPTK